MRFPCAPLIIFFTVLSSVLTAQTDSVYSRMILGSAGYKTIFGGPDKYARSQSANLQRLGSNELAERALHKCYEHQTVQPADEIIRSQAKKCTAALQLRTSGDTVAIAFGNPNINGLVPANYLDNLMLVMLEDNLLFAMNTNSATTDSVTALADAARIDFYNAEATLHSFCGTSEFHTASAVLINELTDTVTVLKSKLRSAGYEDQDIARLFLLLDTAMHRLGIALADTSVALKRKNAGAAIAVLQCEQLLSRLCSQVNAALFVLADTTGISLLTEHERGTLYFVLDEVLNGEKVQELYSYSNACNSTPAPNVSYTAAQQQYRDCSLKLRKLYDARARSQVFKTTIVPGSYILCVASKTKC